ncbi:MAG: hypothetical protein IT324_07820 [Anaerolineae bacterium]|nr:hypothetical protein [Anaerolineae bacterium]
MTKPILTPQLLAALVAATPEGFFDESELHRYDFGDQSSAEVIQTAVDSGQVGQEGTYLYDPRRLTAEQVRAWRDLYDGAFPQLKGDGLPANRPVRDRMRAREDQLRRMGDPVFTRLLHQFEDTPGYLPTSQLSNESGDDGAVMLLVDMGFLKLHHDWVFDPLRITRGSLKAIQRTHVIAPIHDEMIALLNSKPGKTAPRVDLVERFGLNTLETVMETGNFALFTVPSARGEVVWVRLKDSDLQEAHRIALEAVQPRDEDWQLALDQAGEVFRPGAQDGETRRDQVLARSYTLATAASRLKIRQETLQNAVSERLLIAFVDPEGVLRIPASEIESILSDPEWLDQITGMEVVRIREVAIALNTSTEALRQRLRKANVKAHNSKLYWWQIRGLLELPDQLPEFRALYRTRKLEWEAERDRRREEERAERAEQRRAERAKRDAERRQREELRAKLLAAFPTWQHPGRADQRVLLHVGPPNSGKTHQALEALSIANNGWYLAPLRLLAFEVFDRLNQRGIRCNLLTGEEYIPVPGAQVTAATIEMFNPDRSGDCVVIDEAQMLADPDRGWAWTRALMEAQAPDIHVIGPPSARDLILRLSGAAEIPTEIMQHERLAPIALARDPWPIEMLPERTILVAFSRRMVLHLKTELEMMKRTVSVVYGNLPPEVRRKQADRFADGKTEICIATDAVGMGLNLPADHVCFYELEKFDGREVRPLLPSEVHQIGGRAGRYGISTAGEIGATTRRGLKTLKSLYAIPPEDLTHARVAPVVEDLELLPGNLARRFAQWAELQSIPESLKGVLKPADIDERIALARMLTDKEVNQLGLAVAVRLVNAPTRENSRFYWRDCATAILNEWPMPMPPDAPIQIENDHDLEVTEHCISCADIYLWLSRREEFRQFAPDELRVREMRQVWSMSIDGALLRRLDTLARCVNCRKPLPLGHRYSLCDDCYHHRSEWW